MSLANILASAQDGNNGYDVAVRYADASNTMLFPNLVTNAAGPLVISDSSAQIRTTAILTQSNLVNYGTCGVYTQRLGNVVTVTLRGLTGAVAVGLNEGIQLSYIIPAAERPTDVVNYPCIVVSGGLRVGGVVQVGASGVILLGLNGATPAPTPFVAGTVCGLGAAGGVTFSYPIGPIA